MFYCSHYSVVFCEESDPLSHNCRGWNLERGERLRSLLYVDHLQSLHRLDVCPSRPAGSVPAKPNLYWVRSASVVVITDLSFPSILTANWNYIKSKSNSRFLRRTLTSTGFSQQQVRFFSFFNSQCVAGRLQPVLELGSNSITNTALLMHRLMIC